MILPLMNSQKIFINKQEWQQFSEKEMEDYVILVFEHYRKNGFPYYSIDSNYRLKEFDTFIKYKGQVLYGNTINQTMHGLALAWSYMPHSWNVQCNNTKTPYEAFMDDDIFKRVIRKRIQMGDNMSDNGIRKMLKIYSGVQSVSNFRPTAAHAIYQNFCNTNDHVLDMSAGYGGRLLGAIKSQVNYVGYEPCVETYNGLKNIIKDFGGNQTIINLGSEFIDYTNYFDFAFTSPPYFNTEKYSEEDTQSWKKYPTKELWLNVFMKNTFTNTFKSLKPNKFMAINIANVKSYPTLVNDVKLMAENCGFKHVNILQLTLSNINLKNKNNSFKYEPILIFQKC